MMRVSQKDVRKVVDDYEDRHKHLRGFYCRIDLLAIVKSAYRVAQPTDRDTEAEARKEKKQ